MKSQESRKKAQAIKAFWTFYQEFYYQTRYYEHYKTRCQRINTGVAVLLLASSLTGISGLWLWEKHQGAWALIAAILQVVSASTFLMPYSEQSWAIARLIPEFEILFADADYVWHNIDTKSSAEIFDLIYAYSIKTTFIEQRYIGSMYFPVSKHCRKLAIKDRNRFNIVAFRIRQKRK